MQTYGDAPAPAPVNMHRRNSVIYQFLIKLRVDSLLDGLQLRWIRPHWHQLALPLHSLATTTTKRQLEVADIDSANPVVYLWWMFKRHFQSIFPKKLLINIDSCTKETWIPSSALPKESNSVHTDRWIRWTRRCCLCCSWWWRTRCGVCCLWAMCLCSTCWWLFVFIRPWELLVRVWFLYNFPHTHILLK